MQVIRFLIVRHLLRMAMFRTMREEAIVTISLYTVSNCMTANCILRRLAAENTIINYTSRHFDQRKIPVPHRCRLCIQHLHHTFEVPFSTAFPVLACLGFDMLFHELLHSATVLT